ncbi:MAG: hypothetical protein WA749_00980 [Gelidibacter sp.]
MERDKDDRDMYRDNDKNIGGNGNRQNEGNDRNRDAHQNSDYDLDENADYDRNTDNDNDRRMDQGPDEDAYKDQDSNNSNLSNSQDREKKWKDIHHDYRRRYPDITDEDVDYNEGEFDNMTDRIAKRTNRSRNLVNDEIDNWGYSDDNRNR